MGFRLLFCLGTESDDGSPSEGDAKGAMVVVCTVLDSGLELMGISSGDGEAFAENDEGSPITLSSSSSGISEAP